MRMQGTMSTSSRDLTELPRYVEWYGVMGW